MAENPSYLVLNPRDCTYSLVTGPHNLTELADSLDCTSIEENGTYCDGTAPRYQVIELGELGDLPFTLFDLR